MEKPITIRPYEATDYEALSQVHDAARKIELHLAGLDEAFLPFTVAAEREDFFEYPHIDVALWGSSLLGFCAYTEEELAWLYVAPEHHRQGIGKGLVENALKTAPGIADIEVLVGNEPAKRLYEAFGFLQKEIAEGAMPGNEAFAVKVYCMRR